jgi:quercetin dioxygenase-like cupin family protein
MTDNFRAAAPNFRWQDVSLLEYKQEGAAPFKDITRQTLFHDQNLACELRYFEMAPGGYSTLERHQHVHAVTILRGFGRCLLGDQIHQVAPLDLITIPPWTWHQFKADQSQAMGFLCMVNRDRDRPMLPTPDDLNQLRQHPAIAGFLDGDGL